MQNLSSSVNDAGRYRNGKTPKDHKSANLDGALEIGKPFNPWRGICGFYPPEIVGGLTTATAWRDGKPEERRVTDGPKRVYERLVRFAGKDGFCWPSQATLSNKLGRHERQIRRDLEALEDFRLIARTVKGKGRGQGVITRYDFLFHPSFTPFCKPTSEPVTSGHEPGLQPDKTVVTTGQDCTYNRTKLDAHIRNEFGTQESGTQNHSSSSREHSHSETERPPAETETGSTTTSLPDGINPTEPEPDPEPTPETAAAEPIEPYVIEAVAEVIEAEVVVEASEETAVVRIDEPDTEPWQTPRNVECVRDCLQVHRAGGDFAGTGMWWELARRGGGPRIHASDRPDVWIAQRVAACFSGHDDFVGWISDMAERWPGRKVQSWGFYLADARNWPTRREEVLMKQEARQAVMRAEAEEEARRAAQQEAQRRRQAEERERRERERCGTCKDAGIVTEESTGLYRWCGCVHAERMRAAHGDDWPGEINDGERKAQHWQAQSDHWDVLYRRLTPMQRKRLPGLMKASLEFLEAGPDRRDEMLAEFEHRTRAFHTAGGGTMVDPTPGPAIETVSSGTHPAWVCGDSGNTGMGVRA